MHVPAEYRFAVAPMIDWTDKHCRYFHRLISQHAVLYTEMIVDQAIINGDAARLLDTGAVEGLVVLQLGGSEPEILAQAAKIATEYDYHGINLNCGCPSDRVQSGTFGAVLMKDPARVVRALEALVAATHLPVSLKTRIGVDEDAPEKTLPQFLHMLRDTGVQGVTIHARKAWLQGLSPKDNRTIPPLDYDLVRDMRAQFPELHIAINGGVETLEDAKSLYDEGFAGVMLGRAAYGDPYAVLSQVDKEFFGDAKTPPSRVQILEALADYAETHMRNGGRLHQITRHILGLYTGLPGARRFRQILSSEATKPEADMSVIYRAADAVESAAA